MRRCLQLAQKGIYTTPPNPMVGSVIVYQGKIIGEGYHIKPGQSHAEINAINSVKDKSLLKKSTLYVNLEPCSHYGKTPPCAVKIAELGIPEVVIGVKDYSAKVNGRGMEIMRQAGIKVTAGVLEKEAFELNKRFFVNQLLHRPYIILKWAQTSDGYLDYKEKSERKVNWITDEFSRLRVHKQRAVESAVLTGAETVRKDNPRLTVRYWAAGKQPLRIVFFGRFDEKLADSHLFNDDNETVIVNFGREKVNIRNNGKRLIEAYGKSLEEVMQILYEEYEVFSVIVEGGRHTLDAFIGAGLWDEANVYTGTVSFGSGIEAPQIKGHITHLEVVDGIEIRVVKNKLYENLIDRFQ